VNSKVSVAANYDWATDHSLSPAAVWQGIATYVKFQANSWFAVAPRYEYFKDRDGFTTGTPQNLQDLTLTAEFKHKDGFLMRVEYRGDFSNTEYFTKNVSEPTRNQNELTLSWVSAFSSKTP
jgi:Putative beta-barrel porin-2, OmpL-like. bbp2